MKLVHIRQVKREIRFLGLAASTMDEVHALVGVVYRGRLAVDGVLSSVSASLDLTCAAVDMIRDSDHFNQVRVLAVDLDRLPHGAGMDLEGLVEGTYKPVLGLTKARVEINERYMFPWRGLTVTSVGLSRGDAERVLEMCSAEGYPEALRVAFLVADSLSLLHKV